jgi:7,8-dihydropterin-6-yl-methyl-4-(beta-D-ribofuranosyl)aminobenzene 5'-phosphate synthase
MKITVVIENTQDDLKRLAFEHGLSLYIEKAGKTVLFDTGSSGAFVDNAKKLGIDIKNVDAVVLSHGHHDHGGGLLSFFKENDKASVYMKREASRDFVARHLFHERYAGIDKRVFTEHSGRIRYVDRFSEIGNDIYIITDIEKKYPTPTSNKYLFVKTGDRLVRDSFDHELIMVIKENDRLNVITGCSHNGVNNMIQAVKNNFPKEKIKTVVGGFHLMKTSKVRCTETDAISKMFQAENIEKIYTGHCTGKTAFKRLKSLLGDRIELLKTGAVID